MYLARRVENTRVLEDVVFGVMCFIGEKRQKKPEKKTELQRGEKNKKIPTRQKTFLEKTRPAARAK